MKYEEIKRVLDFMPDQNEKFDVVLDFAKNLEPMPNHLESEEIKGCASLVNMSYEKRDDKYHFYAKADSKMVSGIIFIILSIINDKTKSEITKLDILSSLKSLNLDISFQRQSGIESIIKWVKTVLDKVS